MMLLNLRRSRQYPNSFIISPPILISGRCRLREPEDAELVFLQLSKVYFPFSAMFHTSTRAAVSDASRSRFTPVTRGLQVIEIGKSTAPLES